jgi:hypothetical protein
MWIRRLAKVGFIVLLSVVLAFVASTTLMYASATARSTFAGISGFHPTVIFGHVYLDGGPVGVPDRDGDPGVAVIVKSASGKRMARTVSQAGGKFRVTVSRGGIYDVTAQLDQSPCTTVHLYARSHQRVDVTIGCSIP